jgi:signal transduction histidine kinase
MEWLAERAHRLEVERDQQSFLTAAAERARIAREMHDVVSHNLQVMVTLADAAAVAQRTDQARATEAMVEVSGTGRQALRDMRRLLGLLREGADGHERATNREANAELKPNATSRPNSNRERDRGADPDSGLDAEHLTPQPGLAELGGLTKRVRSTGLDVEVEQSGQPFALSGAAELTVYRIVQEALTNALKHAVCARSVRVTLAYGEPDMTVRIVDDGRATSPGVSSSPQGDGHEEPVAGSASTHAARGGGHGILGMAERAAAFDGHLSAGPRAEGGWQVTATLRGCKAPALL